MEELIIKTTKNKEVVDITDQIEDLIVRNHVKNGLCHLFLAHTTAALTTSVIDEKSELDLIGMFEITVPHSPLLGEKQSVFHTHHHDHLGSHIISSFVGCSLVIPVVEGRLKLGKLQRIVLLEFHGPRDRHLFVDHGKATITVTVAN